MKESFDGGKYTVYFDEGILAADRHGEPWRDQVKHISKHHTPHDGKCGGADCIHDTVCGLRTSTQTVDGNSFAMRANIGEFIISIRRRP